MKNIRMGIAALFLTIMGVFAMSAPASAGDSGWQLRGWAQGSASYTGCQGYLRVYDSPFNYTIGQISGYNTCDMYTGFQRVDVTYNSGGTLDRWNSFAGHYVSGTNSWDFVVGSQTGNCSWVQVTIHSSPQTAWC